MRICLTRQRIIPWESNPRPLDPTLQLLAVGHNTSYRAPDIFRVDPDYHSGSRAKSGFSDFPHYLQNLSSDLQLQYL